MSEQSAGTGKIDESIPFATNTESEFTKKTYPGGQPADEIIPVEKPKQS